MPAGLRRARPDLPTADKLHTSLFRSVSFEQFLDTRAAIRPGSLEGRLTGIGLSIDVGSLVQKQLQQARPTVTRGKCIAC